MSVYLEQLYALSGEHSFSSREAASSRPLLIAGNGDVWTIDRTLECASRVAAGLANAGVEPGDRVALHLGNSCEFAIAYLACFQLGAIAAPLNLRFKQPELEDIMERIKPHAYIGDADRVGTLASALVDNIDESRRFVVGGPSSVRARTWASLAESATVLAPRAVDLNAPAVLLSSSGTTGKPKLIAHSQATLMEIASRLSSNVLADTRIFAFFAPMVHASGLFYFLAACLSGSTLIMLDAMNPDAILDGIEQYGCESMTASRAMAMQLIEHQTSRPRDVRTLRRCVSSGDVCPADTREAFHAAMGTPLRAMWASTEGAGSLECSAATPPAYRPAKSVETKLIDAQGNTVAAGEAGELAIRAPNVALGYWTRAEGVAYFPDGWYRTGDAMREDGKGNYVFVSRIKDLIVRASSNISPLEVEQVLLRHPFVKDAGVVGVPDRELGQRVVGFVQLAVGASIDRLADVLKYASSQLADYKLPERLIAIAELPRNSMGKMDRAALLEML